MIAAAALVFPCRQPFVTRVSGQPRRHLRDDARDLQLCSQGNDLQLPYKSNTAFFRRGTSGAGREILSGEELAAYYARAAQLAPPDMLTWLHSSHQSL